MTLTLVLVIATMMAAGILLTAVHALDEAKGSMLADRRKATAAFGWSGGQVAEHWIVRASRHV